MSNKSPQELKSDVRTLIRRNYGEHYKEDEIVDAIANLFHSHMQTAFDDAVGKTIELRADIDDELLEYVPDIKERSLEVSGVPSSFTNLYTRAVVKSTQTKIRERAAKWLGGDK